MKSTPPSEPHLADIARSALAGARAGAGQTLAGWPVLLGRAVFYVLLLTVLTALWDKVSTEHLPGGLAGALPRQGLTLYVGVTEWVALSIPAIHLRLEDDIRGGALEAWLLRPKSYLVQRVAEACGGMVVRLAATGVAALLFLAASGRAWPPLEVLGLLVVVGPLAGVIGVLLLTLAGLSAFWARRTLPVMLVIQKMLFLLGGLFAPITLYPTWLARLGAFSPFAAHLYYPAVLTLQTAAGPGLRDMALAALASQIAWTLLLGGLIAVIWRAGVARVLRGEI